MNRVEQAVRAALIAAVFGLASAVALPAAAVCELSGDLAYEEGSGTGGTGVLGDEGSGTGGTGVLGDEGSGTGGTGVLGTITGFGSVCVNGLRIGYDDETPVERDGRAVPAKDLAVGHVVRVTADRGAPMRARRIVMERAISGPVTRVDREERRIFVMGQPVELPEGVAAPVLEPGARAEVSGQRRADGVVVASRVDRGEPGGRDSVVGVAVSVSRETAYLGDMRVKVSPAGGGVATGERVVLQGTWNGRTGTLEDVRVAPASVREPGVGRLSLQGFAFNALTSYSDPEYMRDDLFYADPSWLFDHCKRTYSSQVALLHDYGLYEFTILVRKNAARPTSSNRPPE